MRIKVLGILLVLSTGLFSVWASLLPPQDITGAAKIFIVHPKNPPVRQRSPSATTKHDKSASTNSEPVPRGTQQPVSDMNDALEDALALGNSARDGEPPRSEDAEKAYRLAAKLNPKDPRPYIGLGNLWSDQKRYAEASRIYKQALIAMASDSSGRKWTLRGQAASPGWDDQSAEWHAYLGNTLLQTKDFAAAGIEFQNATERNPTNDQWHALRGYSLLQQGRFGEASRSLREALRLKPGKVEYRQLLQLANNRKKASE
jgi:Flp pilus assembly protein TadD